MPENKIYPVFIPHGGCKNNCIFCNQYGITGQDCLPKLQEIDIGLMSVSHHDKMELAYYGGSFTSLDHITMMKYLEYGQELLVKDRISSIRISTHPNAIDKEIVETLRCYGVSTVELGVQSLDDDVLAFAGRGHGSKEVFDAIDILRDGGMKIGVQLMLGLPHDNRDKVLLGLKRLMAHKPDFVRIYPLLVMKYTPLEMMYNKGDYTPLSLDEAVELSVDMLAYLMYHDVNVIRMGLQHTDQMVVGDSIIAGPYHESFGNMVKAGLMCRQMMMLLDQTNFDTVKFWCNPNDIPLVVGYKKGNYKKISDLYQVEPKTTANKEIDRGTIGISSIKGTKIVASLSRYDFLDKYVINLT